MNNPLGVMQGRLLPKYQGRYQAHPVGYWADEFPRAAALGLDCIEFILDHNDAERNPLLSATGREAIRCVSAKTGVRVLSVCADYFMEAPLHAADEGVAQASGEVLGRLILAAQALGIRDIVIPCVDQSSLSDQAQVDRFRQRLAEHLPLAERCQVNLALETDLNPADFAELLARLDHPRVTVNYDIGNSAALGYDPADELAAYGERISDIHIKDRVRGGGSVRLGSGHADIPGFIAKLARFDYTGPFIMQAYRDEEGEKIFREQLEWVHRYLDEPA
jgi:hexulose-6-phosphate isomerase